MPAVISAPQPLAVEAGAQVLQQGGNAIDAAITCAFVQCILDPHSCGVGGYALANLHIAGSDGSAGLDAPALAGANVKPDMWEDRLIRPNPAGWGYFLRDQLNDYGYTSICTPGWVKGMAEILARWGSRSWPEVIAPAIKIAQEGFMVPDRLARGWKQKAAYPEATTLLDKIERNAAARRIYLGNGGEPYDIGEKLANPDYAQTLRRLAQDGADDFYHGKLATEMATDLAQNGSFVTVDDFASYQVRENAAVNGTYRGYAVSSAASPHGGPTLIAILNILEQFELSAMEHNSPGYIYLVAMAMKAAFADRNPYMADPDFVDVPQQWMMSKERAAYWKEHIESGKEIEVSFAVAGPPSTTHVTVVDGQGNCIALTHSLGSSSGIITPGMGFMYNNSMINFHPTSGHPNSIAPGKGRSTGMAPTIVYQNGNPLLVLGSPGATRIITSNLQVILNVLDFGMTIEEAVFAPRFDCQVEAIRCHMRIPEAVCAEVRKRHPIEKIPYSHGGFALVHAATIDPQSGSVAGAADSGADGMALVV